jgi:acetylornithine deacetylase/succinyl-diaminopimelate desuccinylase-like protein
MSTLDAVLNRIDQDIGQSVERLFALLRIPSISTDPAFAPQCREAAEHVANDLRSIGFEATVRPTEGHPVVVGKSNGVSGPHVLFYGHYDVQPVDPLNLWKTPPFEPRIETLPDGRKIIVARGACDDKGQAMTFIEACRAFKAISGKLPLPITMMIEGEEECGSKSLFKFVGDNAEEFKLDLALVCDTAMWDQKTPAITTSLRGLVYEDVKITGADRDLHSGVFGGAAQNPIRLLAKILGALWDDDGRVTIPGFYDGVAELPPDIKADLKSLDLTPEKFLGPIGLKIPAGEKDRMLIELVTTRPTAEINGIIGGYTGDGAKTVIPGQASAKVSFRERHRADLRRHAAIVGRRAVGVDRRARLPDRPQRLGQIDAAQDRGRPGRPDSGSRFVQPGATVRYLPQEPDFTGFATTLAYVEAGLGPGDDHYQARYLLEQLGLTATGRPRASLRRRGPPRGAGAGAGALARYPAARRADQPSRSHHHRMAGKRTRQPPQRAGDHQP